MTIEDIRDKIIKNSEFESNTTHIRQLEIHFVEQYGINSLYHLNLRGEIVDDKMSGYKVDFDITTSLNKLEELSLNLNQWVFDSKSFKTFIFTVQMLYNSQFNTVLHKDIDEVTYVNINVYKNEYYGCPVGPKGEPGLPGDIMNLINDTTLNDTIQNYIYNNLQYGA